MEKLVSCHIITYNQKNYIRQCIDGALMQNTTFDYEIVIGDDCSTDGTKDILLEYAILYPNKIKLNLREKRGDGILGKENFTTTLHNDLVNNKRIYLPAGNAKFTLIDVRDIGAVSAIILTNISQHINKSYCSSPLIERTHRDKVKLINFISTNYEHKKTNIRRKSKDCSGI